MHACMCMCVRMYVCMISLFLIDCSDDEVHVTRYAGSSKRNAAYVCVYVWMYGCMYVYKYDQFVSG